MASYDNSQLYKKTKDLDEEYMKSIAKYKGTPFYEQMAANPWLYGRNGDYSPNFWQGIEEVVFGNFSGRENYYNDLLNKRNQHLSELIAQYEQYKQNQPDVLAEAERKAGLNPDLTGVSGVGTMPENDQPMIQGPAAGNGESALPQVLSGGAHLVMSLFQLGQTMQQYEMNNLSIASQEIANNKSAQDFVIESIAKQAPFKDENEFDKSDLDSWVSPVLEVAMKGDYSHYSPRTRKFIKYHYDRYDKMLKEGKDTLGVAALKAQLRNQFVQNQTQAATGASSKVFDEGFLNMVKNIGENFSELEFKLQKLGFESGIASAEAEIAENKYNIMYFDYANSQGLHRDSVDAEKEGYQAQKKYNEAQKLINDTWDQTIKFLKGGDKWYNAFGVILASYIRSQSLHLPSVNISGPKTTTNDFHKDEYYTNKNVTINGAD